jgi:hypothetical protein
VVAVDERLKREGPLVLSGGGDDGLGDFHGVEGGGSGGIWQSRGGMSVDPHPLSRVINSEWERKLTFPASSSVSRACAKVRASSSL